MSRTSAQFAKAAGLVLLTSAMASCSSIPIPGLGGGGPGGGRASQQYADEPVANIYNRGADLLDQRRWAEATQQFQEVERQHPYSSWARRAILMTAFAQYQARQYDEATETARRFISLHPGNENAPYAYYLVAVCYFEQILDVGRDQHTTELAMEALQEVVRRYPASDYARDARLKIDMTNDQLAGREMEVGRFYLFQQQHLAAVNRFRNVVENPSYQRTTHAAEALYRLVECYLSLGMQPEAQRAAAILGHNYPGSDWYQRAFALMEGRGVAQVDQQEAERRGWFSRTVGRVF